MLCMFHGTWAVNDDILGNVLLWFVYLSKAHRLWIVATTSHFQWKYLKYEVEKERKNRANPISAEQKHWAHCMLKRRKKKISWTVADTRTTFVGNSLKRMFLTAVHMVCLKAEHKKNIFFFFIQVLLNV